MGGGQSRESEEAIRDAQRREDERRKREFEAEQAALNRNQKEREDQRRDNRLREEAEQRRQDERDRELREERRKNEEAAERRRQEEERVQHERKMEAEKRADERFREQRDFNQAEIKEKTSEHKEAMTKKEKEKADTETRFEEKAVKLEKEKKEEQEKFYSDAREFDAKRLETSRRHHTEIENQQGKNFKILEEIEKNATEHEQRMVIGNANFMAGQMRQVAAGECDAVENHFIDSVNNTRNSGRDVMNAIKNLGNYAFSLREGKTAPKDKVEILEVAIRRTQLKLQTLIDSTASILAQAEKNNEGVLKCQEIARDIKDVANHLVNSIQQFSGSLEDDPIQNSPALFKEVLNCSMELDRLISSFPALSRSNHTTRAIMENVQSITVSAGIGRLEGSGSRPAIEEQ